MSGWPAPRDWVGAAPYPWPQPAWLEPGERFSGCFTVLAAGLVRGAEGDAVLEVELSDARGTTVGWLPADAPESEWLQPGLYVGVRGTVEAAAGWHLRIAELSPVRVSLEDLPLFLAHTPADTAALEAELERLIKSIREPGLHDLVSRLVGPDSEVGRGFRLAPAASRNHHAYLGGLFEHTISVARLCDIVADHYGDGIDRDLLITGALLHDIGKVREIGARAGFPYTDEGRLLGHILLGLQMIGEAAAGIGVEPERRLLLEHLVASHQGRYEWQSPREPVVLEGFILHYVDNLDAKVNHVQQLLETVDAGWTEYDRSLRRELLRHAATLPNPPGPAVSRAEPVSAREAAVADITKPEEPPAAAGKKASGSTDRSAGRPGPVRKRKAAKKKASARKGNARKKTSARAGGRKTTGRSKRKPQAKPRGKALAATPSVVESGTPSGGPVRRPVPGPGMPGFMDRDTLDLFEQTKGPTP